MFVREQLKHCPFRVYSRFVHPQTMRSIVELCLGARKQISSNCRQTHLAISITYNTISGNTQVWSRNCPRGIRFNLTIFLNTLHHRIFTHSRVIRNAQCNVRIVSWNDIKYVLFYRNGLKSQLYNYHRWNSVQIQIYRFVFEWLRSNDTAVRPHSWTAYQSMFSLCHIHHRCYLDVLLEGWFQVLCLVVIGWRLLLLPRLLHTRLVVGIAF